VPDVNLPGVVVGEAPAVPVIEGAEFGVTAFVGCFGRGPMDRPVRLHSVGELAARMGALLPQSEAGIALYRFFAEGGRTAIVVRVASGTPRAARVTLAGESGSGVLVAIAGREHAGAPVGEPGMWGSRLRLEIDHPDPGDPTRFDLTVVERDADGRAARTEVHTGCSTETASSDHVAVAVNPSSSLVQLHPVPGATGRPAATGTSGGTPSGVRLVDGEMLVVKAGGRAVAARLSLPQPTAALSRLAPALQRAIRSAAADPPGHHLLTRMRVTHAGGRLRVRTAKPVHAGRVGRPFICEDDETAIITFAEHEGGRTAEALGLVGPDVVANVQRYVLDSPRTIGFQIGREAGQEADDGGPPDAAALRGSGGAGTGMYAVRAVEDPPDVLCLPAAANLDADAAAEVYREAADLCAAVAAVLLIDLPVGVRRAQDAVRWIDNAGLRHRNAATYFPRLRVPDLLTGGRLRSVAASGSVAGVYARMELHRGVWRAPAGAAASVHGSPDVLLTDRDSDVLNPAGVNAIRALPSLGTVLWGARTLAAPSDDPESIYVSVRRGLLYLHRTLDRGLRWTVFEPNDEGLWARVRLAVEAFLRAQWRAGAFPGSTEDRAYYVRCDRTTMTQDDIENGRLICFVGIAPLKPAEFVTFRIDQSTG
jgi:uncharacterized protein